MTTQPKFNLFLSYKFALYIFKSHIDAYIYLGTQTLLQEAPKFRDTNFTRGT